MGSEKGQGGAIGSGLERRNSCLKLKSGPRYTAQQEYEAYRALDALMSDLEGVRLPQIYGVDSDHNSIRLEYIEGQNLMEDFLQHGVVAFERQHEVLIPLFAKTQPLGKRFDSDPSNFLVDADTEFFGVGRSSICRNRFVRFLYGGFFVGADQRFY